VKHIRAAIFGLETTRLSASAGAGAGLRERSLSLLREAGGPLGFEPRVMFDGAVDTLVPDTIAADLLATLGEALTNVARHARASRVDVAVIVDADILLRVTDDGVGPPGPDAPRGHGLDNMAARAARHGGSLALERGPDGGTVTEWRVPRP
jgi:signal transduction histidine kinase